MPRVYMRNRLDPDITVAPVILIPGRSLSFTGRSLTVSMPLGVVYGPQSFNTKPDGAVDINAANPNTIQTAINANPNNTKFWLKAGTHVVTAGTANIVPKPGNVFAGEFGAILDGTGWSSSNPDDGAFKCLSGAITGVTFRNLLIRDMPRKGISAGNNTGTVSGWTIEYCEITNCGNLGVSPPHNSTVYRNLIHNNVNGGYGTFQIDGVLFWQNQFHDNGAIHKIVEADGTIFRDNWFHDNAGDGIWYDTNSINAIIEDNLIENEGRHGIHWEQNYSVICRGNLIRNCVSDTAIMIAISQDGDFYDNDIIDNFRGIRYLTKPGVTLADHPEWDLANNTVRDNRITVPTTAGAFANGLNAAWPPGDEATYPATVWTNFSKNNTFSNNDYTVPTGFAKWGWGSAWTNKTWAQWQALNGNTFDTTGSRTEY